MGNVTIRDLKVVNTRPSGANLTVVKVETSEPGLGIDIDEKLAARFPCDDSVKQGTQTRLPDGTYNHP